MRRQRAIDVDGAPMGLQINSNHAPSAREQRQDLVEHFDRAQPAVAQDQRFSAAVDFLIEFEAVQRRETSFDGGGCACLSKSKARYCQDDYGSGGCD
jgi:hypothetical protein